MSLDGAVAEGLKPLCACLSRQIDYQKQLKQNMETLESKRRTLIATNNDIKRRVEFAELQGGSASNQVTHWLQEVESMERKVSDTQRDFEEQKKCWKGLFPNYYRRRKISKKSSILIGQVDELITNGKFENGVTEPLPLATNALPTMPIVGKTAELTREEIWNCILGTEKRIIGVHGMGGVGKTTIMRNIHNDLSQQSEPKHFDCFIWITVSNDVDVNKLQRKIAKELNIDMKEDDEYCFLFCSLYPEDHKISANELINNWIYEGLIDKRGTREDNINKGHTILDQLVKVSMLERCGNRVGAMFVKMHDLIRNMAIDITRAENPRSVIYAGRRLQDLSTEFPEDAERISLMDNDIEELSGEPNCQHLLTLFLQKNPLQKISPDSYFNHMCSLRVLNLSFTKINSLPESVSYLKNLRALILNGCRDLEGVPSLEKLEELRVLDLSGTKIRELPSGVEAMIYLQRLHLDDTGELRVFPAGIIPRLSHLEELTMGGSIWKWSSKTVEAAGIEEIMNSTRLAILNIQFKELSDFLQHAKSNKWQTMTRFSLAVGRYVLLAPMVECSFVAIDGCDLIGEENQLLLPDTTQRLVISNCQISSLWHFTRLLHKSELYRCEIERCKNMEYLMAEEEPLLPDIKELKIFCIPELLVLCKGIPSPDALKSLESLEVFGCNKLKHLLPARLLQQLRCLKSIKVSGCRQMKEIVGEEEEMGITRDDDNNAMLILSQLQSLTIYFLPELKGIFSGVFICNALETITIASCPQLKTLPFSVDNLPCALKEIGGKEEWWDAVEWDHPRTKAHFDSIPKKWRRWLEDAFKEIMKESLSDRTKTTEDPSIIKNT